MLTTEWAKYTVTAAIGVLAGLAATFANITISSQSRVAAIESHVLHLDKTLARIEGKIDAQAKK